MVAALLVVGVISCWLYVRHARVAPAPLIDLSLLKVATFRASVVGGFIYRIGIGATPFLLPLLLQLGFGLTPFQSGMLTFSTAIGAIAMKTTAPAILRRFGFKHVLIVNSVISAFFIATPAFFTLATPHAIILTVLLVGGFFKSLQFTSINSLAYADIEPRAMSRATSFASVAQQLSMSAGVAVGALVLEFERHGRPAAAVEIGDFATAFVVVGALSAAFRFRLHDVAEGSRREPLGLGAVGRHAARFGVAGLKPFSGDAPAVVAMVAVGNAAVVTVLGHQRGENAFAQTPVGDAQALARPDPQQRLEDGAAGQHEIGAFLADARLRHTLGIAHVDQVLRHGTGVVGAEPATVDAGALIGRKLEMNAGDGGDGSRGTEKMRSALGDAAIEAMRVLEILDRSHHVVDHGLVAFLRHVAPAVTLGEAHHADRQRGPGGDAVLRVDPVVDGAVHRLIEPFEIEPDQLRAAAANIEDERPVTLPVDQRGAAGHREPRFGLPAHDLDGKSGVVAHAVDELGGVGGDAASLGGDQARPRHAAPPHLIRADLEGLDGTGHGGIGQPARAVHALAEANDAGERVDDEKAAAGRPRDQ